MTFEEYKVLLAENQAIIDQVQARREALPYLHWYLTRHKGKMLTRVKAILHLLAGIDNQTYYRKQWMAFISIRHLARQGQDIASCHRTWHSTLLMLQALGLITRHKPSEGDIDNRYMADSLTRRKDQAPIGYMGAPAYTEKRLLLADRMAKKLRNSQVSTSKLSKADVIQIWGSKVANKIYQDGRTETALQKDIAKELTSTASRLIQEEGYTTRERLIQATADDLKRKYAPGSIDHYNQVERLYKARGRGILTAGGITYQAPTRQQIEAYGLSNRQWIYQVER